MSYLFFVGFVSLLAVAAASITLTVSGLGEWLDRGFDLFEYVVFAATLGVAIASSAGVLVMMTA